MLTVQATRFGGPDVLAACPAADPEAGPGQVVVRTAAADVLFVDTAIRADPRLTRMEFTEVIRRRRMIRAFTTGPLPAGLTGRLLAAAARAPSAGFSQGFSFLVFEGAEQCALIHRGHW